MDRQYVENRNIPFNPSTYPDAYSDAKNVFIVLPVMTCWDGKTQYGIEEVKI